MSDDDKPVDVTLIVNGKEYKQVWFVAYNLDDDMIQTIIGGSPNLNTPTAHASVLADLAHGVAAKFGIEPMSMLAMLTMAFIGGELPDDTECVAIDLSVGVNDDEDEDDASPPPRLQ